MPLICIFVALDKSHRQGNICHTHTVVRWLGNTYILPCGTADYYRHLASTAIATLHMATDELTHSYKGCME